MSRLRLLALWLLGLGVLLSPATVLQAHAAGDSMDSYDIAYTVNADGSVDATETIVWRFGEDSGRHGILREFITREPEKDDPGQDIVYTYSDFTVESPDAPDQFTTNYDADFVDRIATTTLQIGDPDTTVSADTATYVITYTVEGTLRDFEDYDEFYWDAVGTGWQATLNDISVTVDVPGGVQDATCYVGEMGSTTECATVGVSGGTYQASHPQLSAGEGLTVGAMITDGAVADASPHLQPSLRHNLAAEAKDKAVLGGFAALITAVLSAIGGRMVIHRRRDLRYLDLPPGTVPAYDENARVGPTGRITVPVRFEPPELDVAAAGWLHDGKLTGRESAATLIAMAVGGVLHIAGDRRQGYRLTLLDPRRATTATQQAMLSHLFPGGQPGQTRALYDGTALRQGHRAVERAVSAQDRKQGWWLHRPGAKFVTPLGRLFRLLEVILYLLVFGFPVVLVVGFALIFSDDVSVSHPLLQRLTTFNPWHLLWLIPIVMALIPVRIGVNRTEKVTSARGQRSAHGRALTDQVDGFHEYLRTAEADQLRFEEGRDIYSEFLPWAIAFGLADRWAKVCRDAVDMGLISPPAYFWWTGNSRTGWFDARYFERDVVRESAPPAPRTTSSSSGTGAGSSSSSFSSGGGYSGGGGGGGGGSSW